jgi:two-component system cell cycle sensor histidine kinase/response regulator CckA
LSSNKPESPSKNLKRNDNPRGTETILVVEDDPIVRKVAVRILERQGYHVFQADSGHSALGLVEKQEVRIDLMMTDVLMPHMNGRELADKLKKQVHKEIKVLFTSGYGPESMAINGVLEEGIQFIPKPYTPRELAKKIRTVLDDGEEPR